MNKLMRIAAIGLVGCAGSVFAWPGDNVKTIKVYEPDMLGNPNKFAGPTAVIETDMSTGQSKVYEPDMLGNPNKFAGPKAIVETDQHTGRTTVYEPDALGNKSIFSKPIAIYE